MLNLEELELLDLSKFGLFGKSYSLSETIPSFEELCRFCMLEDGLSNKLLQLIENNMEIYEFKKFKQEYFANTKSGILQNLWLDIRTKNSDSSKEIIYHSGRRKWLGVAEKTELRDYQFECAEQIKSNLESGVSSLLILPTGAGKTKTVLHAIRDRIDENKDPIHVLWVAHTSPLCAQTEDAIQKAWIEPRKNKFHSHIWMNSVFNSGLRLAANMFGDNPSFTIATPDSIERSNWSDDINLFDIIVFDEAHHGVEEQKRIVDLWPDTSIIGITATPELVNNQKTFNTLYKDAVFPKEFIQKHGGKNWKDARAIMIREEYLSDYGEVIEKDLAHELDKLNYQFKPKSKWTDQPCTVVIANELCKSMITEGCKRILLFVEGVEQARSIAGFLRDNGISTSAVYGGLSRDERESRISGFSSGHFQVLVSVNILREGIDVPLVDGILMMRKNLENGDPMFTQILGRGLRGPRSGGTKECLVWHAV